MHILCIYSAIPIHFEYVRPHCNRYERVPQTAPNSITINRVELKEISSGRHFWDLNLEVLILASLAMIISGRIRTSAILTSASSLRLQNFDFVGDVAGFHWSWTPLSDSLELSSMLLCIGDRDMRPIVLCCHLSRHLNKVGKLDHTSFFSPRSFMARSSNSKPKSGQAREEGIDT
jgi:hypothetical protein